MQDIYPYLKFTIEVGEGDEGWLPTLDTQLRVEDNNVVSYRFYKKPLTLWSPRGQLSMKTPNIERVLGQEQKTPTY